MTSNARYGRFFPDNCFACHGPDAKTRMADLRLDIREGAFTQRQNGSPVIPGDFNASLLYQRITHQNEMLRMPPAHSKKELTEDQIDVLKRWIGEGASWDQHWSFKAIKRPEPPAVKDEAWVRRPLDRFILARLEKEGLSQNIVDSFNPVEPDAAGPLPGALVQIAQSPFVVAKAFRSSTDPTVAQRAQEVIDALGGPAAEEYWRQVARDNTAVTTTLRKLGLEVSARLMYHSYVLTMCNLYVIFGPAHGWSLGAIPDRERFVRLARGGLAPSGRDAGL